MMRHPVSALLCCQVGRWECLPALSMSVELDNGCVDIVVLPVVSTVAMAQIMLSLAPGKHVLDERIKTYRATRLSAEAAETSASLPVNIDGDVLGHLPATFTVRRGAFEVFRPLDFVVQHERRYCFG